MKRLFPKLKFIIGIIILSAVLLSEKHVYGDILQTAPPKDMSEGIRQTLREYHQQQMNKFNPISSVSILKSIEIIRCAYKGDFKGANAFSKPPEPVGTVDQPVLLLTSKVDVPSEWRKSLVNKPTFMAGLYGIEEHGSFSENTYFVAVKCFYLSSRGKRYGKTFKINFDKNFVTDFKFVNHASVPDID